MFGSLENNKKEKGFTATLMIKNFEEFSWKMIDGYQAPAHIIIFLHSSDPILCLDLEKKKKKGIENESTSTSFLKVEVLNLCRELMAAKSW